MDWAGRRERLRAWLDEHGVEAAVVTSLVNVRYLTGFTGSNAALLVTPAAAVLATDSRYLEQARGQCPDVELVQARQCDVALVERVREHGPARVALEEHVVTVAQHRRLSAAAQGIELVDLGTAVEQLRAVKDDDEIGCIRTACEISTAALTDLLARPLAGRTEREVADDLERLFRHHGAQGPAFATIVGAGANGALPHHEPDATTIERGDLVVVDFGARYEGYHADCTRTVSVGEPTGWQQEVYDLVRQAQRAGRHALQPDANARDVDAAARDVIVAAGHGEHFGHGLGHGVGLEIHEAPMLGYGSRGSMADRMTVTVEPGVYLPGRGGVRIEDALVVRPGGPELLTTFPKDLVVLDA